MFLKIFAAKLFANMHNHFFQFFFQFFVIVAHLARLMPFFVHIEPNQP